jgi:hypothetical protein
MYALNWEAIKSAVSIAIMIIAKIEKELQFN